MLYGQVLNFKDSKKTFTHWNKKRYYEDQENTTQRDLHVGQTTKTEKNQSMQLQTLFHAQALSLIHTSLTQCINVPSHVQPDTTHKKLKTDVCNMIVQNHYTKVNIYPPFVYSLQHSVSACSLYLYLYSDNPMTVSTKTF